MAWSFWQILGGMVDPILDAWRGPLLVVGGVLGSIPGRFANRLSEL
jgi:hypothetical protein